MKKVDSSAFESTFLRFAIIGRFDFWLHETEEKTSVLQASFDLAALVNSS
ncbi:hypothetical protein V7068_10210 [Bacillus sp. JJ634]